MNGFIDNVVLPMFQVFICIGFLFLIGAFINIIKDKIKGNANQKIFQKRDIKNAGMDTFLISLKEIKGYSKILVYKNYIIRIHEYGIDAIIICDFYGILTGLEEDITWNFKNNDSRQVIANPLIEFKKYIDLIENKLNIKDINRYILLGSNTILNNSFKNVKVIRTNEARYVLATKGLKKYTKEQVDEFYKKINV